MGAPQHKKAVEFAELLCTSCFSFLKSASHPEEMVEQACLLGYTSIAVTDECSLAGIVRAHQTAESLGIHLLVGAQFVFSEGCEYAGHRVVLLVKNKTGYTHLCQLITQARARRKKGDYLFLKEDLASTPPGLIVLLVPSPHDSATTIGQLCQWASARFSGRCALLCRHTLTGFDVQWQRFLASLSVLYSMPVAASCDALIHSHEQKQLLDVMTAIRVNQSLTDARFALHPNSERVLKPLNRLSEQFPKEWLQTSVQLARQCHFSLNELKYQYPREIAPNQTSPEAYLKEVTWQGAIERYGVTQVHEIPQAVAQQLEHELSLIAELHYEAYFLTVYDLVRFARSRGILCQGRGSAANSAVCYCLGITEVDPARMSVLFERFISRERNEPPDIDVDFEHHRREEVIQYIYEKYGRHRAALAASVVVYRPRSAIRDAGKALGLDADLIDTLAKSQDGMYARQLNADYVQQSGIDLQAPQVARCLYFADQLLGFPRHLSQHTGGFVIARDNLNELVPVENASMADRTVIQWDKDDLDAMGLLKVDVLALGMLSAIRMTLDALHAKSSAPRTLQEIPPEDPHTYSMISRAETIGVFQVESRAQMSMLPRLQPRCFYDLVIQVAIVRPGPIQGGMVHPFLQRRQGHAPVEFPSNALRNALERTEGVPIFQEQVMQIAILAAGFTPGEADQLRRGMAAWKRRGGLNQFHERVVGGMIERGYQKEFAENIFKQIEGFGEYGFPESHAASFALLVYVSSWLKCHHPDAFLCGLLNAQPMGFYQPAQLIREACRQGVEVRPVDIQSSEVNSQLEPAEKTNIARLPVRLGLNRIKGLSLNMAEIIVRERLNRGLYRSVEDLVKRTGLDRKNLLCLAQSDALRSLSGHRRQASWQAAGTDYSKDLLRESRIVEQTVQLEEPSPFAEMSADYQSMNLSLQHHPIHFLRPSIQSTGILPIQQLMHYPDRRLAKACGLVTHRQRPQTAKGTIFLTLEDETGSLNVIVNPALAEKERPILRQAQIMGVFGVWQSVDGVKNLIAKRIVDYTHLLGEIRIQSRDFH